jgi:Zn-finger nucleic acid-binding protein
MIVLELDQIEIDYCLECGGIWLDSGELELLLDDPSGAKEILKHPTTTIQDEKSDRKCPICLKPMREIGVGSESRVHIDRCAGDHGLWFDRGELEIILGILDTRDDSRVAKLLKDMFGKQAQ